MIQRWGAVSGSSTGEIVRGGVPRDWTMAILDYTWQERQTIATDNLVKIRLSCIPDDPGIDEMLDSIVFQNKLYKIEAKPRGPNPGGSFVYVDLDCIFVEAVS